MSGPEAALAAARATTTVPIVFAGLTFPVEQGLVESLARPGRNVTGVCDIAGDEMFKRYELLREILPQARRLWWFVGPGYGETLAGGQVDLDTPFRAAASRAGFDVHLFPVRSVEDIDAGLASAPAGRAQALVAGTAYAPPRSQAIADFCRRHRLPCATSSSSAVELTGMLVRYGPPADEFGALRRRAADMIDRILRGARPGEIAVEQPRRFELVLNLKTARAIGLAVPRALLARADRLIE